MADAAQPPAAAAVPEGTGSSTPSAASATLEPPKPVAPAMPAKTLSWASLAKQNLPTQQPASTAPKPTTSSSKATSSKRPSGPSPLGAGKSAGGTSTTKASGGGSKVNGSSQKSTGAGAGPAASAKDLDEHPFTTVTTSRSASSRSVDWRRKDENGAGQPKARRVEKEKGDKPAHRHGEKKAGPAKEGGKTGPSSAKGGPKKADAAAAAGTSSSTTTSKPIVEDDASTPAAPAKKDDSPQESASAAPAEHLPVAEPPAAAEPSTAEAAPATGATPAAIVEEQPKPALGETKSAEAAVVTTTAEEAPAPPPAPKPRSVAKPPAVNIWKLRASSAGPASAQTKPPPKGFPTASAAAAIAQAAKAESIPTPSSSPPASTTSLFTPSNSSATTASPPSTLPATSTTPSLADEAWPEPSMAATAAATSSRASTAAVEGEEVGKAAPTAEGAPSKTKKEKKKWVAISPAELQASVDQANAASGKGKKTAKRPTDDAASAANRTAPKKKSVGEGSMTSQPSNASANGTTAPTKKAKKAAAAALASSQGNGGPSGPYPPPSLIQHHSPHLDNFQPPPSAYNPHLADMPILPISHLTSAEELVMPQHFDLTAGLPSAGPLSAMDGSLDADNVEISKDVEMSLLKQSGGRANLGGRVEGNGVPADTASLLLKDHEAMALGGQGPPPSTSSLMDRTRSAPLSGAIPIIAPPSNGLNVQSSVFRPANAGTRSPRGSAPTMRGGSSNASASGGRGGSQSGRLPGANYTGRPNPFAGLYQQGPGQPGSHDGRNPYLSPPPSGGPPLGPGGLPPSPHSSFGSYPKDSSMPRLSPQQVPGSFGSFPAPQPPFGQPTQAAAGGSSLGLSNGPTGNGAPYGAYHAPPPMPLPVTVPTVPLEPLRFYLLGQLEYYFGAHNLVKDFFLRKSMDSLGFVDIPTIAAFNRVKTLTLDLALVREVLLLSDLVEVREQKVRLTSCGWQQWLLPDALASDFEDDASSPAAVKAEAPEGTADKSSAAAPEVALQTVADEKAEKATATESAAPSAADGVTPPAGALEADEELNQS